MYVFRDANNPLDMKPLPKEPDDERRKKSKVAKGTYSIELKYIHSQIARNIRAFLYVCIAEFLFA